MSTQQQAVELLAKDLTASGEAYCPHPKADMARWNTHPRVFLKLLDGEAKCPYCGTVYRLRDHGGAASHH